MLTIDISQGIQREAVLNFCRDCDRWLLPPAAWQVAAPESRELLALCLKKLRLQKARVIDASFVWTEPHSRRIKVKITVQDSVSEVLIQQSFVVTYTVHSQQCPECAQSFTPNHWRACVQVRQKVCDLIPPIFPSGRPTCHGHTTVEIAESWALLHRVEQCD